MLLLRLSILKFTTCHMVVVSILYAFEGCVVHFFIIFFRIRRVHNQDNMGHVLWTTMHISHSMIMYLVSVNSCFKMLLLPLFVLKFTTGHMVVVSVYAFESCLVLFLLYILEVHNQANIGHLLWTILFISLRIIMSLVSVHSCFKICCYYYVYPFWNLLLVIWSWWVYWLSCALFYFTFQENASAQPVWYGTFVMDDLAYLAKHYYVLGECPQLF